jgi:hypothetical protein
MSHYAKIENNIVTQVIVAEQDFIDTQDGQWLQTSYNTRGGVHYTTITTLSGDKKISKRVPDNGDALRKNFAGIGFTYNERLDAFIPPQPKPTWVLDEDTCLWKAPTT